MDGIFDKTQKSMLKTLPFFVLFILGANTIIAQKTLQTPLNYKANTFNNDLKGQIDKFHRNILYFPKSQDELHLIKPSALVPNVRLDCNGLPITPEPIFDITNGNDEGLVLWRTSGNNKKVKSSDAQSSAFADSLLKKFGNHFFFQELNIPKDKFYHFITFCSHSNVAELYDANRTLELLELLKKESELYHKSIK
ncbi:hypothetical protein [Tenacibaculum xiamenense]|uniref:hypothetical protein n=1 Tax=Tenacibaculum xiamenense TaxID=1261553 RepID=UPI0038962CEF